MSNHIDFVACAPVVGWLLLAGVGSMILTRVCRILALRWGVVDLPDGGRKQHLQAIPLLGGVAISAAWLLGGVVLGNACWAPLPVIASLLGFCLVGLWDDWRGLSPSSKLCLQVLAAIPFAVGWNAVTHGSFLGWEFSCGSWSILLILAGVVAATNGLNLLDGLDGLAATLGIVGGTGIALLAVFNGRSDVALAAALLAIVLAGFLTQNWHPARIFLGDCGSLVIGFLLLALALESARGTGTRVVLLFPWALFAIPGWDMSAAIIRRLATGRSIAQGDRGHLHHILRLRGWSVPRVVLSIAGALAVLLVAALVGTVVENGLIVVGTICLFPLVSIRGRFFGHIEVELIAYRLSALLQAGRAWLLKPIADPKLPPSSG